LDLGAPPEQLADTFGLDFEPRQVAAANNPAYWAIRDVDPTSPIDYASLAADEVESDYRTLLLLVSGIQMAGPRLTPMSFAHGLHGSAFPNPDTSIMAGHVGFPGASTSMTLDGAEYWWSNTDRGPYSESRAGTICYVDHGARYTYDTWPTGPDAFFRQPCDSG
jgi:hypothetical protein